jgi:hypothetical protein
MLNFVATIASELADFEGLDGQPDSHIKPRHPRMCDTPGSALIESRSPART